MFILACVLGCSFVVGCAHLPIGRHTDLATRESKQTREAKPQRESKSRPGNYDKQIREAREQSAEMPADPYWPYRLGELYRSADSLANAEAQLKVALQRNPCYAPALSLLSQLYFVSGRHEDAVRMIESARSRPEGFPGGIPPELLAGLALHYDAMERPDLARAAMPKASGREPGGTGSAAVYMMLRGSDPDSARNLAAVDQREHPKSAASRNNYGITRLRAGDPVGARRAFEEAIQLDPQLPGPYYNLTILEAFYTFDDAAAARWFKLYQQRAKDDPDHLAQQLGKSQQPPGGLAEQRDGR